MVVEKGTATRVSSGCQHCIGSRTLSLDGGGTADGRSRYMASRTGFCGRCGIGTQGMVVGRQIARGQNHMFSACFLPNQTTKRYGRDYNSRPAPL